MVPGPPVQARPEGIYLVIYTRSQDAEFYDLSLGSTFTPPVYSGYLMSMYSTLLYSKSKISPPTDIVATSQELLLAFSNINIKQHFLKGVLAY